MTVDDVKPGTKVCSGENKKLSCVCENKKTFLKVGSRSSGAEFKLSEASQKW